MVYAALVALTLVQDTRSFDRQVMKGPGIAVAEGCYEFSSLSEGQPSTICFPIPQVYEEQAPFHIEFITRPENAIARVTYKERTDAKPNWLVEVEFKPMRKGEKVYFNWKGYVLVINKDYSGLPKSAPIPKAASLPKEVQPWLRSTKSVQVDDAGIQAKAKEIRDPQGSLIQTIKNAIAFSTKMSQNIKRGNDRPHDCSAVTALHWGEICTGSAHLAAALLRANGIPARLLANYPIWNMLFATHYYVEAYIPGFGWTRAESIMNVFPVETTRDVILSVVYPEDEDKSFDSPRWAALAVPHFSLTQPVGRVGLNFTYPWKNGDHVATPVAPFTGSPQDFQAALKLAKDVWTRFLKANGDIPKRAKDLQKKASGAKSLVEFVSALQSIK